MLSRSPFLLLPLLILACAPYKVLMPENGAPPKIAPGSRIGIHFTARARGPANGLDSSLFNMFQGKFQARMEGDGCGNFTSVPVGPVGETFTGKLVSPARTLLPKAFSVSVPAASAGDSLAYVLVIDEAAFGSYSGGGRDVAVGAAMAGGGMAAAAIAGSSNSMSSREEFKFVLWDYRAKEAAAYGIAKLKVKEKEGEAGEFDADARALERVFREKLFPACRLPGRIR